MNLPTLTCLATLVLGMELAVAQKSLEFQDAQAKGPIASERNLVIKLPILEFPQIVVTTRDPFISADVKDPYITDSTIERMETKKATGELIEFINKALTEAIKNSIKILGVSSSEPSGNYALIWGVSPDTDNMDNTTPTQKMEGESVNVRITPKGMAALQEAMFLAKQNGFNLELGFNIPMPSTTDTENPLPQEEAPPTEINILIQKIDRRSVYFLYEPAEQIFHIDFTKDLNIRDKQEKQDKDSNIETPKEGRPPKI